MRQASSAYSDLGRGVNEEGSVQPNVVPTVKLEGLKLNRAVVGQYEFMWTSVQSMTHSSA